MENKKQERQDQLQAQLKAEAKGIFMRFTSYSPREELGGIQRSWFEHVLVDVLLDRDVAKYRQAISFMIWTNEKGYYVPNDNQPRTWCNGPRGEWPQTCYTDEELYDLFLEDELKRYGK